MTLVVVERLKNRVSLSSDSRISFGSGNYIDYGVKVFSVPINITSPIQSENGAFQVVYNYIIGLAVAGSSINAYTVKESIYEILQNLQYLPGYTDFSLKGIADLVFKVFNKTSTDLGNMMQKGGLCQLILQGYCPEQKKIRVFLFTTDLSDYPFKPYHKEILFDDGIEFFGTGITEAKKVHEGNPSLGPLHIVRQVIKDGKEETVGGGIQYGEFEGANFKIFGVTDYETNEDGTFKGYLYTLRGINLYRDEFERADEEFHVAYTFKTPFEKEIDNLRKKEYGEDFES